MDTEKVKKAVQYALYAIGILFVILMIAFNETRPVKAKSELDIMGSSKPIRYYQQQEDGTEIEMDSLDDIDNNDAMYREKVNTHIVTPGDTLYSIGRKYDISPIKLMRINKCGKSKCNRLIVGDEVNLGFN